MVIRDDEFRIRELYGGVDVATYSNVFKSIKKEVVAASVEILPALWKAESNTDKFFMMRGWLDKVCAAYGVTPPTFEFLPEDKDGYRATGGGCYFIDDNKIVLYKKASFVTLAHEFRHFMQYRANVKKYLGDDEHDARAWSVSLFKTASPKNYGRAVANGILHFA